MSDVLWGSLGNSRFAQTVTKKAHWTNCWQYNLYMCFSIQRKDQLFEYTVILINAIPLKNLPKNQKLD